MQRITGNMKISFPLRTREKIRLVLLLLCVGYSHGMPHVLRFGKIFFSKNTFGVVVYAVCRVSCESVDVSAALPLGVCVNITSKAWVLNARCSFKCASLKRVEMLAYMLFKWKSVEKATFPNFIFVPPSHMQKLRTGWVRCKTSRSNVNNLWWCRWLYPLKTWFQSHVPYCL